MRRELTAFAGVALLGAVGGAVAKAADASLLTWAADLATDPAIWVLARVARLSPVGACAAMLPRFTRTRAWALPLVFPIVIIVGRLLDAVMGRLLWLVR